MLHVVSSWWYLVLPGMEVSLPSSANVAGDLGLVPVASQSSRLGSST